MLYTVYINEHIFDKSKFLIFNHNYSVLILLKLLRIYNFLKSISRQQYQLSKYKKIGRFIFRRILIHNLLTSFRFIPIKFQSYLLILLNLQINKSLLILSLAWLINDYTTLHLLYLTNHSHHHHMLILQQTLR